MDWWTLSPRPKSTASQIVFSSKTNAFRRKIQGWPQPQVALYRMASRGFSPTHHSHLLAPWATKPIGKTRGHGPSRNVAFGGRCKWKDCWNELIHNKAAHTALAVKACLLGGNSYTKCSITFVNIAVAISALAGGGQKRFRTETRIRWCFRHFSRIFGCLSARGYWNWILGHFGSFPAMEKRPKIKKNIVHSKICRVFGCQSIENTTKTSVLDWRYSKKRVNYRMLDWKHYKNTVKSNVLEGFTAFMAKKV